MSDPVTEPAGNLATPPAPPAAPAPAFSQDDVNRFVAEEKRKWKQQQDEATNRAKQQAEEAAASARGEFEQLATERASRIVALESEHQTVTERLTAMEAEIERQVKARLRALPEEIRAMAPDADALTRYAWLEKAETAAAKLVQVVPTNGTPGGPRGIGTAVATATDTDLIAKKRAQMTGR